jgi:hypothetical protein
MVLKTSGLADVLREALAEPGIRAAFVFGSLACNNGKAGSDVDLLVIGTISLRQLGKLLSDISADWLFCIAYSAALKLCTILLHASGYRPERALQHYRTIAALPLILGDARKDDADYLETCRTKRNTAEYAVPAGRINAELKRR